VRHWIGANDFAAGLATGNINPRATVENIRSGIALLSSVGARTFIVINLPDIALTPQVKAAQTIIQAARQFVFTVNILLEVELVPFAWRQGITVEIVDINRLFVPLVLNPVRFGFTNNSGFALDPRTGGGDTNPNVLRRLDGKRLFHAAAENGVTVIVLFDKEVFVVLAHNCFPDCIYFAVGRVCGLFERIFKHQRMHGLLFICFIQWKRGCCFAIPLNAVPGAPTMPGHDAECDDRGLTPVFDLRKTVSRSLPTDSRPLPVIEIVAGVMW
jgi:hypothetical protein